MDAILEPLRTVWEGEIDFEGQRLVELLSTVLLSTVGFLAFIIGFATQNIHNTLWIGLGGTAVTFVVCVPPWPWYNKNPVQWLPRRKAVRPSGGFSRTDVDIGGVNITVDGKKVQ